MANKKVIKKCHLTIYYFSLPPKRFTTIPVGYWLDIEEVIQWMDRLSEYHRLVEAAPVIVYNYNPVDG